jgi:predicted ATPase
VRPDLPIGTVTFVFTDVEGSTRLLEEIGDEAYEEALSVHRRIVRAACHAHDGVEVDTQGDAFFFAFPEPSGALAAAQQMTKGLGAGPIHVRVGLHTGTPRLGEEGYVGSDVHFGARIAASAHGGQVVLSQATRDLVEGYVLTELGEHRLKDIEESVPIFQLGDGLFPPLKTISNTNLPRPASSFVGREAELDEVLTRIDGGARLVTLTGPGGTGKTRLALEAAMSLVPEYKAGVFWVGLASLRDPALVTETISQTLGAKDGLVDHISEREVLLLLDNLEQVIDAAPALSSLLQGCPNLTLLVTSRELLRVQGEVEYEVPPLQEPEAVSLFCERSQLKPSEEILELCRRLDSLPLAVELAAARTKALTPAQITERLSGRLDLLRGGRDADPRQQTLRAAIEWSYELLSADEQKLFARLSVFAGGCTLEAAEEVCDADLDTLQSLVEKSLLRFTASDNGNRYWMLETIREFASDQLEESGEGEAIGRRHAAYVVRRLVPLRAFEPRLTPDDAADLPDLGDVRSAKAWAERSGDVRLEFSVTVSAAPLWQMRGRYEEGLRALDDALSHSRNEPPERLAPGLRWAADLALRLGDSRAVELAEEGVRLCELVGDEVALGAGLLKLGQTLSTVDEYDRATDVLHRAATILEPHGPTIWLAAVVDTLGYIELVRGEYAHAADHMTQALEIDRAHGGGGWRTAGGLQNLALARLCLGELQEAEALFEESLVLSIELHADPMVANHLEGVAALSVARGELDRAALLLGAAGAARERLETPLEQFEQQLHAKTLARLEEQLGRARLRELTNEGSMLSLEEAVEHSRAFVD